MADVLSQSQIDALLKSMQDEYTKRGERGTKACGGFGSGKSEEGGSSC